MPVSIHHRTHGACRDFTKICNRRQPHRPRQESEKTRSMLETLEVSESTVATVAGIRPPGGKFLIGRYANVPLGVEVVAERASRCEDQLLVWPLNREWQFKERFFEDT
ncbi:hypothetical protein BDW69DRAFT_5615 [Aspergillus filifer]